MASLPHVISSFTSFCKNQEILSAGVPIRPFLLNRGAHTGRGNAKTLCRLEGCGLLSRDRRRKEKARNPRCSVISNSGGSEDETSDATKTPFGYTRKDVLLIGVGVTAIGVGLKSGLEYAGVDSLQAGNAVQFIIVLGLTVGWISTYIFRVSNKEMTYAQQLRDYEKKVMQKRLESLSEAELEALLEQVDEEKRRLESGEQVN